MCTAKFGCSRRCHLGLPQHGRSGVPTGSQPKHPQACHFQLPRLCCNPQACHFQSAAQQMMSVRSSHATGAAHHTNFPCQVWSLPPSRRPRLVSSQALILQGCMLFYQAAQSLIPLTHLIVVPLTICAASPAVLIAFWQYSLPLPWIHVTGSTSTKHIYQALHARLITCRNTATTSPTETEKKTEP